MYFTDSEAASLDRWITGNYGEDQHWNDATPICMNCVYYSKEDDPEDGGTCVCKVSPHWFQDMDWDDGCSWFEGER
jgi:hypothetical protein